MSPDRYPLAVRGWLILGCAVAAWVWLADAVIAVTLL